ncbi:MULTISPECIES: acyl-CoA thioesterase [unclassified Streptomyces]|uniref:acyl-CoA thioesterase n=1 Tax=unclassified Streptomyces TaxID=2593676 RepID=UPI0032469626
MTTDPRTTDPRKNGSAPLLRRRFRVAVGDTDAAQVIYFAAPTRWAERLSSEWLAEVGFPTSKMLAAGFGLPAVHCELTYHSPLRLDDELDATLWLDRLSTRSLTFRSDFALVGAPEPAVRMRLTQVYVRMSGAAPESLPLPDGLVARLQGASTGSPSTPDIDTLVENSS